MHDDAHINSIVPSVVQFLNYNLQIGRDDVTDEVTFNATWTKFEIYEETILQFLLCFNYDLRINRGMFKILQIRYYIFNEIFKQNIVKKDESNSTTVPLSVY